MLIVLGEPGTALCLEDDNFFLFAFFDGEGEGEWDLERTGEEVDDEEETTEPFSSESGERERTGELVLVVLLFATTTPPAEKEAYFDSNKTFFNSFLLATHTLTGSANSFIKVFNAAFFFKA